MAGTRIDRVRESSHRFFARSCLALGLAMVAIGAVQAQTVPSQRQEQRERARHQAEQRRQMRRQPDVRLQKRQPTDYRRHQLPRETPCFTLKTIRLEGPHLDTFPRVADYLREYAGRCVGQKGLDLIVRRASDLILSRGYVTTRLLIPEQDLSSGHLRLLLVPGLVGHIRFAKGSDTAFWRGALPLRTGDILNLRAIEQGLEQLRRVPSQQVHIDIAPGDHPGVSDLVLKVQRTRRWRYLFNYNDAGSEFTGRQQGGITLAIDQPLGINDLLSVGVTRYVGRDGPQKGTLGNQFQYSLPWDNWTFALGAYRYAYHQPVHGTVRDFETGGRSRTTSLAATRLLYRDSHSRTSLRLTVSGREAHSNIEGVEIQVQRRRTRAVELALLQRRYLGNAQLDIALAQKRGVPWLGGQSDRAGQPRNAPTFRYIVNTLDVDLSLPFRWVGQPWLWSSTLHAQTSPDHLYAEDYITIGGRYTVRGFDGEQVLGGERGVFWRNSLGLSLGHSGMRLYGGMDMGWIGGPSADRYASQSLAGVFVGLRGARFGLHWNVFAGWAIHAPDSMSTRRPAAGMQVLYRF